MPFRYNMVHEELNVDIDKLEKLSDLELEMYQVIDDIDTYSDMAKENYKLYQALVMNRIENFHKLKLVYSDGYNVRKLPKELRNDNTLQQ